MADSRQAHAEGQPQPLRASSDGASGRTAAGRLKCVLCRRPRLRLPEATRVLTEELCFDYVIRFRGNIAVTATTGETCTAVRLGAIRQTRLRAARRRGHRRSLSGGNRRLRSGPRHEAGLVLAASSTTATAKHLIDTMLAAGYRVRAARYQGSALRHGAGRNPCQIAGAA